MNEKFEKFNVELDLLRRNSNTERSIVSKIKPQRAEIACIDSKQFKNSHSSTELTSLLLTIGLQMKLKIINLQKNQEKMESSLDDIIQVVSSNNCSVTKQNQMDSDKTDEIESLRNAIECMKKQMNEQDIISMRNAEINNKINHQVHVLSSMFVKFNARICGQLLDFNRQTGNKLELERVVEPEATKFIGDDNLNVSVLESHIMSSSQSVKTTTTTLQSKEKDIIISDIKYAHHRFVNSIDTYAYTRHIKVALVSTKIKNWVHLNTNLNSDLSHSLVKTQ